ncbi:hypothetical protein EMCG_06110 [[Emmonsia] crescens]|uniref:Uncharacterized protein n=1 Tax=[Emmonsia] crescens TaxID=73230 RepID=A0A0G2J759_9EURO|nr:hypothetical protein EMCG_06110 [Emmonsia crescens UAMH 3008]
MSNALSLTGLETFSPPEKARRIAAVANDITASIIYIAKQAAAENLSAEQIAPIYELIDKVNVVGKRHNRRLEKELEEQDRQIEKMRRVIEGVDLVVGQLKARTVRLESELRELRGS